MVRAKAGRQRAKEKLSSTVYSKNDLSGQGQAELHKPGTPLRSPMWVRGLPACGLSPVAFPRTLVGSWIEVEQVGLKTVSL